MSENLNELFKAVEQWGLDRQIIQNSSMQAQFLKLVSEIGELGDAIAKNDHEEIDDAIGDSIVVLIMIAAIHGRDAGKCLAGAYDVIRHRKGYLTPDGVFVKQGAV